MASSLPPSEHPQRREVVQIVVCDAAGEIANKTFPIEREGERAWLSEPLDQSNRVPAGGRLTTLLVETMH